MESKEVSVQTALDSEPIEELSESFSNTQNKRRPARSQKTLKIKNVHVEKMRMQKLMTLSFKKTEKNPKIEKNFRSNFLERLRIDASSNFIKDKKMLQLSCQGRQIQVLKKEEKKDDWAKRRSGQCSTARNKNITFKTLELLDEKEKDFQTFKNFRESKVLSCRMIKKIGHLRLKQEVLNFFK